MKRCHACLHGYEEQEAVLCDHTPPSYVCPHCESCSCGTAHEEIVISAEPGSELVEAFHRGEDRVDRELLANFRDIFRRYEAVPVGIEDDTLYVYVSKVTRTVRDDLLADLLAAGLPVERIQVRIKRELPGRPQIRPVAGMTEQGLAWDHQGRLQTLEPAERAWLERHGMVIGGRYYPVYHVVFQEAPPAPGDVSLVLQNVVLELQVVRAWLEGFLCYFVGEDNFLQQLAGALGFLVTGSWHEAAYTGGVTVWVEGAQLNIARAPQSSLPAFRRRFMVHVQRFGTCDCGACSGIRAEVVLQPVETRAPKEPRPSAS